MVDFMANIGNRDIQDENGMIRHCRSVGKEYLDRYETVKNELTFPILRKGLDHILSKHERIDRVFLFYTDQPRDQAGKKWESDTVWFARLLEKLIPETYPAKIPTVKTLPIHETPNNLDAMFALYNNLMKNIGSGEEVEHVYLSLAGGIPACNMAMLYRGTQALGTAARLLLIAENTPVSELHVGHTILADFQRQLCSGYLSNYDFTSLDATLRQAPIGTRFGSLLARYFHQRLTMDYLAAAETASAVADAWEKMNPTDKDALSTKTSRILGNESWKSLEDFLLDLQQDLALFTNPLSAPDHDYSARKKVPAEKHWQFWLLTAQQRIGELWLNARIKWETEQYTDFLARLYRINEAILHWIFESETRYSTRKIGHIFPDYQNYLMNEGQNFAEFLNHEGMRKPKIPDVAKLKKFLTWLVKKQGRDDLRPVKKLIDRIGDTNGILYLRNTSIIAHGFTPVTGEKIRELYAGKSIIDDINQTLTLLEIPDHHHKVEWARILISSDWELSD